MVNKPLILGGHVSVQRGIVDEDLAGLRSRGNVRLLKKQTNAFISNVTISNF